MRAQTNEEVEFEEKKKAVYESYHNYMMIPESTIYDYEIVEISLEELKEEEEL